MTQAATPKVCFTDPKAFRLLFIPGLLFGALGFAALFAYDETLGPLTWEFVARLTKTPWLEGPLWCLTSLTPAFLLLCALVIAYLNRFTKLLAEELRHLTQPRGWEETLSSTDLSGLFQRVVDASKALGFRELTMIWGKTFLGIRMGLWGLGYIDVLEVKPGTQANLIVFARPLIPRRVSRNRYKKIMEDLKQRAS